MKSALQTLLEDADLECRSYSGRGMYGKYCLGTEASLQEVMVAIAYGVDDINREEVAEALRRVETDSMGLGMITYFRSVEFVDEEEPLEEDEEEGTENAV